MKEQKKDIEYILEFTVLLGRFMLMSGANLERINLAIENICQSYGLHSVCIFSLSTYLHVSEKSFQGIYCSRQISVPQTSIHLERLQNLNRLSYEVCAERPEPRKLAGMLHKAYLVREYEAWTILLGSFWGRPVSV